MHNKQKQNCEIHNSINTTFPLRRFYRSVLKWVSDRGSVPLEFHNSAQIYNTMRSLRSACESDIRSVG